MYFQVRQSFLKLCQRFVVALLDSRSVIFQKFSGKFSGFQVTFRDPEAARRACADATPIIDGRRANCNLASLGAHRHRPHGQHGIFSSLYECDQNSKSHLFKVWLQKQITEKCP